MGLPSSYSAPHGPAYPGLVHICLRPYEAIEPAILNAGSSKKPNPVLRFGKQAASTAINILYAAMAKTAGASFASA